jgi:hypothetical protein
MNTKPELIVLESSLAAFDRDEIQVETLCETWRQVALSLSSLPPRYRVVLEDILQRMESSALFTDESCSFSMKDMRNSLQFWLEKARQACAAQG